MGFIKYSAFCWNKAICFCIAKRNPFHITVLNSLSLFFADIRNSFHFRNTVILQYDKQLQHVTQFDLYSKFRERTFFKGNQFPWTVSNSNYFDHIPMETE